MKKFMIIKMTYAELFDRTGNALSESQLIQEILLKLQDGDYVEFEDGKQCFNEQDFSNIITERR